MRSGILAVPTAVAGNGMNFDMPELKLVWVYLACLGWLVLFLRERVAWPDERLMA